MNQYWAWFLIATLCAGIGCDSDAPESGSSNLTVVEGDDAKMNAAMDRARSTVDQFIARMQNPQPGDSAFTVKKKVVDGDVVEHFWVSDLSYADGVFSGKLGNEPHQVKNVTFGHAVTVNKSEISDWMYMEGEKIAGNFTLRAMLDRMPQEKSDALRQILKEM